MAPVPDHLVARAIGVRLLLLDVDGVLTNADVAIESEGRETKTFSIRDGAGIVWARRAGLEVALLSGRSSEATSRRAAELGVTTVLQGNPRKKAPFLTLLDEKGLSADQVAYMGDDLHDLPVLTRVGLSGAPADAVPEVKARVHWVSQHAGGRGAVREFVELLLVARNAWDQILKDYLD